MFGEDIGLQLPFDSLKTPGTATRLAAFAFELPPLGGVPVGAPQWLAAFGIQLARYTGQALVPLATAAFNSQDGRLRWRDPAQLNTAHGVTGEAVLAQSQGYWASAQDSPNAAVVAPAAMIIAPGAASIESEQALALVQSAPPEVLAAVDFILVVYVNGTAPRAAFVYNANLFDAGTIARFAAHFQTLLPDLVEHSRAPMAQLTLMSAEEQRLIRALGEGARTSHAATPLHRVFEQRAAATPNAVAVRFRDQALTYVQLNLQANRLAAYLAAQGLGRESRIVVCVEGGFEITIALLAILKAGAVYVPLDPTYPEARIRVILADTQPRLLICRANLADKLSLTDLPVLRIDTDAHRLPDSAGNPEQVIDLNQTAYVYYTSGTTGKPKGVMGSHANLIHYILSAQKRYGITHREVMPALARFSFSISMLQSMSPLAAGGTLILLERDHVIDPARMAQTLQEVTFHAGPSLLRVVIAYIRHRFPDFRAFSKVRHASSGGDMVAPELLEELERDFFGCGSVRDLWMQ